MGRHNGMSLRDYFAGQALASSSEPVDSYEEYADLAKVMYEIADAMIEARKGE